MPLPIIIRNLLKELFDEAEVAPDLQAVSHGISFAGRVWKIHIMLANPDYPDQIIIRFVDKTLAV